MMVAMCLAEVKVLDMSAGDADEKNLHCAQGETFEVDTSSLFLHSLKIPDIDTKFTHSACLKR